ncbi:MAG: cyclic pyranopterin monophosphate synthase MoaC [Chloroflexi bacterium]|nr:cyclic pyranopterin monophosphate synthase MoaC [Chloroflexota bacterium]
MDDCLTHLNEKGEANMVDVSGKAETKRIAVAEGRISMNEAAFAALSDNKLKKGDAFATARIAGIMAAKRTAELIPLCHNIPLEKISLDFTLEEKLTVKVQSEAYSCGKTGVEMEALTAVSAALLTIYDMAKALDRSMRIFDIRLMSKSGGASGDYAG